MENKDAEKLKKKAKKYEKKDRLRCRDYLVERINE